MSISDYYENKILDHMVRGQAFTVPTTVYLSLHTGTGPDETGTPSNEVTNTGGSTYARIPIGTGGSITFAAASGGQMGFTIGNTAEFGGLNGMPAVTVTYVGIYDALTVGNLLWSGPLGTPRTTSVGDFVRLTALTLTLD